MTALQILLLILAAATGATSAWFLKRKTHSEFLSILLSFSGAYLLGVVILHLLPEVFEAGTPHVALFVLLGFFVQFLLVQFTRGIEHGHMHVHEHFSSGYVFGVLFGLSVHAFMEGIPLSALRLQPLELHPLFLGILVHKVPETFALATVLFFSFRRHWIPWLWLLLFACITPLGSGFGSMLSKNSSEADINWLIAIVCGSLIHISTTIIFESGGKTHRIGMYKFAAILAGAGISLLTLL